MIYRSIILPTVVSGCETWSLTVREERKLRVFEKSVPRGILWPKRDKVKGEWRKLHNEKLKDLFSSPNVIQVIKSRRMGGAGHVACMGGGKRRDTYRVLEGKPEGNRPLGRHSIDERIILKWIFRKWDRRPWTRLIWLRIGIGGGFL